MIQALYEVSENVLIFISDFLPKVLLCLSISLLL